MQYGVLVFEELVIWVGISWKRENTWRTWSTRGTSLEEATRRLRGTPLPLPPHHLADILDRVVSKGVRGKTRAGQINDDYHSDRAEDANQGKGALCVDHTQRKGARRRRQGRQ